MWDLIVGVVLAAMATVTLVGLRACLVRRLTSSATQRIDRLQSQMTGWELGNGVRMRELRQRMTDVEDTVVRAQDEAREAAATLANISRDLLERIEAVEPHGELEVLVAEGRIPAEHLPAATPPRSRARARAAAGRHGPPPAPGPLG